MKIRILSLALITTANAETLLNCHDGDTCRFSKSGKVSKVRFSGIDAPEADQPMGSDARNFLVKLLKDKVVTLKCEGVSYDRQTCSVFVGKVDIQSEMVRSGFAMELPRFSRGRYKADEEFARSRKLGIWSKTESISPFCWRFKTAHQCRKNKLFQPR